MPTGVTPGPRNLITDVAGLRVGNAGDARVLSGTTVLVPDTDALAVVDIRGGAPGSRETAVLGLDTMGARVNAIILTGGSVFGLDAASAVTRVLARRGIGFRFGAQAVPCPVIPAAVLFDISNGGEKWPDGDPPYARLGEEALANAGLAFQLGNEGAGLGAVAGQLKGGLGSASAQWGGFTVGALVAVNSVGSCVRPGTCRLWAEDYAIGAEMGPERPSGGTAAAATEPFHGSKLAPTPFGNTPIALVATDAALTRAAAQRFTIMAADGMARAIRPIHTPFDGDTVFGLSTGPGALPATDEAYLTGALGAIAADTLARAIGRALWEAESVGRWRSYRDLLARPDAAY
ncbi:P1 family peptidase [soil metagenome]